MSQYGADAWKMYNNTLVEMLKSAQKQLQDLKSKITEINWQRKNEQTDAGTKLRNLEERLVLPDNSNKSCILLDI